MCKHLNVEKMRIIYQKCLLKAAEKFYGTDRISWVLQDDNDPKHRNKLCRAWKDENKRHNDEMIGSVPRC